MAVTLSDTSVQDRDEEQSARFLIGILALSRHTTMAPFAVVQTCDTSRDLIEDNGNVEVVMARPAAPA